MDGLTWLLGINQQIAVVRADVNVLLPVVDLHQFSFGIFFEFFGHRVHQRHELC